MLYLQGGIVWETALLLATYLEQAGLPRDKGNKSTLKVLEVGAGCGLLGLVMAHMGKRIKVVLSEAAEAMENLSANVNANNTKLPKGSSARPVQLHWGDDDDLRKLTSQDPEPFDVIVGTGAFTHNT